MKLKIAQRRALYLVLEGLKFNGAAKRNHPKNGGEGVTEDERGGIILTYGLEIQHARSNETRLIIFVSGLTLGSNLEKGNDIVLGIQC